MNFPKIIENFTEPTLTFQGSIIESPIDGAIPRTVAIFEDRILVIYNMPGYSFKDLTPANMFAFDKNEKVILQAEPQGPYDDLFSPAYHAFGINDGRLTVFTLKEHVGYVDIETGKVELFGGRFFFKP